MAQEISGSFGFNRLEKELKKLASGQNANIDIDVNGLEKIRELHENLEDLTRQKNQVIVDVTTEFDKNLVKKKANDLWQTIQGLMKDKSNILNKSASDEFINPENILKSAKQRLKIVEEIKKAESEIQKIQNGGLKRKKNETDFDYSNRVKDEIQDYRELQGKLEGSLREFDKGVFNVNAKKFYSYIQNTQEYSQKELDIIKEIIKAVGELNTIYKSIGEPVPEEWNRFINSRLSIPNSISPEELAKLGKTNASQFLAGLQYQKDEAVQKETKQINKEIKDTKAILSELINDELAKFQTALSEGNIDQEGLEQINTSLGELQTIAQSSGLTDQVQQILDITNSLNEAQEKLTQTTVDGEEKQAKAIKETGQARVVASEETSKYTGKTDEELQKCLADEERWLAKCKEGSDAYKRRKANIEEIQGLLNKTVDNTKEDEESQKKEKSARGSKKKAEALNEEADALNKASKAQDLYIRRNTIGNYGDSSYVAALNKITDLHVNKDGDEKRVINGDKLLTEILRLDKLIFEQEQEIQNARDNASKAPLQDILDYYKEQLDIMIKLRDQAINDPTTEFTAYQSQIIEEQRAVQKRLRNDELEKKQIDLLNEALAENAAYEAKAAAEKENHFEQSIKEAEALEKVRQSQRVLDSKKDTKSIKLDEYYNELEKLGLITSKVEDEFTQLRNLLATADTKGLSEYNAALSHFQAEMKESVQEAKKLDQVNKRKEKDDDASRISEQNQLLEKQYSIYSQIWEINKKIAKIDPNDSGSSVKLNALENNRLQLQRELGQARKEEKLLGESEIDIETRLVKYTEIRAKAQREINEINAKSQADIINSISSQQTKVDSLIRNGNWTKEYKEQLIDLSDKISNLFKQAPTMDLSKLQNQWKNLGQTIDNVIGEKSLSRNKKAAQSSLAKLGKSIDDIVAKNSAMGKDFQKRFENLRIRINTAQSNAAVEELKAEIISLESELIRAGKTGKSFVDIFKDRLTGLNAQFIATYFSIQDWIRYIRTAVSTITELDDALVDLRKTTKMSNSELEEFYYDSSDIAKQLGVTTKEIIDQASAWSRLGYNTKDAAEEMAQLSSQFATISPGMDTETAQSGLVSIMKAYDVEVSDVKRNIMDNINTLGNRFAESNEDIVQGMERSAAALSATGTSLEDALALFTGGQEIIQNAEKMGTALRSISLRVRGISEETEEVDDELVNITGDLIDLTKTAQHTEGISIFKEGSTTEFKSFVEYFQEIHDIWDEMTQAQQTAFLNKAFAKTQAQAGAAIIKNIDQVQAAIAEMEKAEGSADREMSIVSESITYKINALQQTWIGLIQELIDRGTIGDLIDALTRISEVIADIATDSTSLISVITAIGGALAFRNRDSILNGLTKGLKTLNDVFSAKNAKNIKAVSDALSEEGKRQEQLIRMGEDFVETERNIGKAGGEAAGASGIGGLSAAFTQLAATLGVSAGALAGILAGITAVIGGTALAIYEIKKANDELRESAQKLANQYSESEKDISKYKEEIQDLHNVINDSNSSYEESKAARERLLAIQDELISKYGIEASAIGDITSAINGQIDALDKLTAKQWQRAINEFNEQNLPGWDYGNRKAHGAADNVGVMLKDMEDYSIDIHFGAADKEIVEQLSKLYNGDYSVANGGPVLKLSGSLSEIEDKLISIQKYARENDISNYGLGSLNKQVSEVSELMDLYGEFYKQYNLQERIFKNANYEKTYQDLTSTYAKYREALVNNDEKAAEEQKRIYVQLFDDLRKSFGKTIDPDETGVYNTLKDLYPELQNEVNKWELKVKLSVEEEESKEDVAALIKSFGSEEELDSYVLTANTALNEKYKTLEAIADSHYLTVEQLVDAYRELGALEGFSERNTSKLADSYFKAINASRGYDINSATQGKVNKALSSLELEDYDIVSNFGLAQWQEVQKELEKIAGTTDLNKAKVNELAQAYTNVAQRCKEAGKEQEAAASAGETWNEHLEKALNKLGMSNKDEESSSNSFKQYLEIIKTLNPELANNQEEAEKCALANLQFSKAVDDLNSNFEKYKESLKDTTKQTPEYAEAISSLTDDLTYLTGVQFDTLSTDKFLADANNLKLLEDALNGSDEALRQLQETAANYVRINIDASQVEALRQKLLSLAQDEEIDVNAFLSTDQFNQQFNDFANWLNTADLGSLEAQSYLNKDPFIQNLMDIASTSEAMANQIKAIFADLGWDVKWDTALMPVVEPSGQHKTSIYAPSSWQKQQALNKANTGYAGSGLVKWNEKKLPIATNVHFVKKGAGTTPTSAYTPKSISPGSSGGSSPKGGGGGGGGGGGSSPDTSPEETLDELGEAAEDTFDELYDYFERFIKVVNQQLDLLEAHAEDVIGAIAKNILINAREEIIKREMNGYSNALEMYSEKASEALSKIPEEIAAKLVNGAVAIDEFIGEGNQEVVDAIHEYEEWSDKVADCRQQLVELKEALRQLELEKFNNLIKDAEDEFNIRENTIDLISKQISIMEEMGRVVDRAGYDEQIKQTNKQLDRSIKERAELVSQMESALKNGVKLCPIL